ncbi:MAG TPA: GIY-YIG nuclease family protein [Terriglobales bacterium]|nr:GIY-YIG nuclease family protein [Terriglobales bacterium]
MAGAYYVYILQSISRRVLYIGVTGDIEHRMFQHKRHVFDGFAAKYQCERLVYDERWQWVHDAIRRDKQLKGWRREKKEWLITQGNPHWKDLSKEWWDELQRVWAAAERTKGPSTPAANSGACAQDDTGRECRESQAETKGPSATRDTAALRSG